MTVTITTDEKMGDDGAKEVGGLLSVNSGITELHFSCDKRKKKKKKKQENK